MRARSSSRTMSFNSRRTVRRSKSEAARATGDAAVGAASAFAGAGARAAQGGGAGAAEAPAVFRGAGAAATGRSGGDAVFSERRCSTTGGAEARPSSNRPSDDLGLQPFLGAGDREAFVVEELADARDDLDVAGGVELGRAFVLAFRERRELGLPVAQHVRRDFRDAARLGRPVHLGFPLRHGVNLPRTPLPAGGL